jgi:hypothetical protein
MAGRLESAGAASGVKSFSTPKGQGSPLGMAEGQDRLLEALRAGRVISFEWDLPNSASRRVTRSMKRSCSHE